MSGFEINSESIKKIKSLVKRKNNRLLKKDLSKLHYADIAEIVGLLSIENATYIIKLLESDKTADALAEIDEDLREKILDKLSSTEIADEIQKLNTDDAADLVAELPEDRKEKVLSKISDTEHLKDIRELLTYEEDTAGAIMAKELVKIQENLSILKCLNIMRIQAENINRVHSIYVVDSNNKLLGRLSLKDLLTANSKAKIKDIYIPKVDYVFVDQEVDQVAKIMFKYDLEAIPVINKKRELLGRITIDDVVDLTKEEAEKDYQLASGISNDVEANDSIYELTKARFPWLFLGLIGGLGSVFILQDFEEVMNSPELRSLFFYTPLIAAMAGNVGVQSSAIIVQGIANDVLRGSIWSRLLKEISLSLINGFLLSSILILFGVLVNQDISLTLTVSISLMGVIIISALIGTFVPIILNKKGIDPAIATGPFITTSNDIFGIFIFFYLAKLILGF
ncbi:MAG: magnesium transporter [Flavobacteriaceae bacterium]|tara:strand:- start:117 stop:1475 length:1359 start_codon:yes stop_codon:yes gene_type:complete